MCRIESEAGYAEWRECVELKVRLGTQNGECVELKVRLGVHKWKECVELKVGLGVHKWRECV